MSKNMIVEFSNGARYAIPLEVIARNQAHSYRDHEDFGGDAEKAFKEFMDDYQQSPYEAADWASNNMNWEDVASVAKQLPTIKPVDYGDEWPNALKTVD